MPRRTRLLIGLAAASVAFAAAAAFAWAQLDAETQQVTPPGTIAFIRDGRLFFMNGDGTAQHGADTRADEFPVWSPDGRKIAYYVRGEVAKIYVAKADGSGRRALTPRGFHDCISIAWSPDSRRIAYALNEGCEGGSAIYVVNADGTGRRKLTPGYPRTDDSDPAWSPDGRRLLYISSTYAGGTNLYVMRPDGREKRLISAHPYKGNGLPTRPPVVWSRDGKRLFFVGGRRVNVMNVDGTRKRRLTPEVRGIRSFALAPDGRQIALAVDDGRDWEIYTVNANGNAFHRLTDNRGVQDQDPRWSPDGRRIVFETDRDGKNEIYTMNTDGSDQRNLSRNRGVDSAPAWSPIQFAVGSREG